MTRTGTLRRQPLPGRPALRLEVFWHLLPAALLCALFAAVGVVHVTSRVMVVSSGYRLSTLEQDAQKLTRENDRLRLELATLKNPSRLDRLAREQLGMAPPPASAVVTLSHQERPAPKPPSGVAVAQRLTAAGARK